jgi:site-specific recombinase XerD
MKSASQDDISIEAAAQDFLATKERKGRTTLDSYRRAVTHFRRWCELQDIVLLKQVALEHVRAYFAEYDGGWTRNTAQARLRNLRVFFNYCCRERRWINYAPTQSRDLNYGGNGQSRRLPFTPAEVTAILAAVEQMPEADRARARALVLVLLYTGMRISDATFLERTYIDTQNNLCYLIIKTRQELPCSIELQSAVMAALQALPASRVYFFQEDREDNYNEPRQALRNGEEFQKFMPGYATRVQNATRLVRRVLDLAGIEGACHRFRDTFAVHMLQAGVDIFTVCQFLGHSDVKITQKHYVKFVPGYRERIAQRTRMLDYKFPLAPVNCR